MSVGNLVHSRETVGRVMGIAMAVRVIAGLMQVASDFDLQSRSTGILPGIPASTGKHLRFSEEDEPEPLGGTATADSPQKGEEHPEGEP